RERVLRPHPRLTAAPWGRAETRERGRSVLRYGPAMDDEDGYFGERVAETYDEESAEMFEPRVVDAAADVLAGLAGGGRGLGLGSWAWGRGASPCRWRAAACRSTASTCRGRWWPGCAPSRAATRSG